MYFMLAKRQTGWITDDDERLYYAFLLSQKGPTPNQMCGGYCLVHSTYKYMPMAHQLF